MHRRLNRRVSPWVTHHLHSLIARNPPTIDVSDLSLRLHSLEQPSPPLRPTLSHSLSSFPPIPSHLHFNVLIIGGGIVGLSCGRHLISQWGSASIGIVESLSIGSGTSSHSTSKFTSNHGLRAVQIEKTKGSGEAVRYLKMNEEAMDDIERTVVADDIRCSLTRCPHVTWTDDRRQNDDIRREAELAKEAGIKVEVVGGEEGRGRILPRSVEFESAVQFDSQLSLNVYSLLAGVCRRFVEMGGRTFENSTVTKISNDTPHRVTVRVEDEGRQVQGGGMNPTEVEVTADVVIVATHLPILDRSGHFAMMPPSRTHCIAFAVNRNAENANDEKTLPMSISASQPTRSIREGDEKGVMVLAGESIIQGDVTDTEGKYAALEDWAKRHFDVKDFISRWSAMDYISSDGIPYIGYIDRGTDTIYTATGMSKWGLTNGWAAGSIITDLILRRENPYHSLVDSRRWNLNSMSGFVTEGIHAVRHFVTEKAKKIAAENINSLKPNEGAIVSLGSTHSAAFCDSNGRYHIISPKCSHLGCDVVFNNGDSTWNCPCHGSVFDIDGKVLHGPACKHIGMGTVAKGQQYVSGERGAPQIRIQWE